jgi:hypothetical protein
MVTNFFVASGVGLSPLYCGHFWTIVQAPDDRWGWLWSNLWNEDLRGNRSTRRKPAPAPLCPTQIPLDQTRDRTRTAAVGIWLHKFELNLLWSLEQMWANVAAAVATGTADVVTRERYELLHSWDVVRVTRWRHVGHTHQTLKMNLKKVVIYWYNKRCFMLIALFILKIWLFKPES